MVTVVPELEVPGHARGLLAALPELAAAPGTRELTVATQWGVFPHIMSPLPATMDVLTDLFGELLGAIPAGFVHIGGDECVLTDWAADPRIIERRDQLGLHTMEALHAHFLRQVADMLAARFGARAVVWDEGFTSSGSAAAGAGGAGGGGGAGLRPDTVVMAWHGMEVARKAAEAGYDVIAAPQVPTYFDWGQAEDDREPLSIGGVITAEDVGAFRPVPSDWPAAAAAHLLGAQFQLWTEYIPDTRILDYKTHPRAGAFADVAWSGAPAPWTAPGAPAPWTAPGAPAPWTAPGAPAPWTAPGAPAPWTAAGGRPALRPRIEADLARLAAAGIEFRPLAGPRPWQQSAP